MKNLPIEMQLDNLRQALTYLANCVEAGEWNKVGSIVTQILDESPSPVEISQ